jgi:cell division protein FtsB
MKLKQMIVRGILVVEMVAFGYMYLFGKNGLQVVHEQNKVLVLLQQTVDQLQTEIDGLTSDIMQWETNDFYKEKIAREQLQMARKGDKLFYRG